MPGTPARSLILSDKALVPISIVVGALVFVVSGTWFVAGFKSDISQLTAEVRELRQSINDRTADSVTSQDMRVYVKVLQRSNPTLQIPDWFK